MKKICALVLALMLLFGAVDALAATTASSTNLLLSMTVNETYTWMLPDAKIDCLVGAWGLWGTIDVKDLVLEDGAKLQISCYSQYYTKFKSNANYKFVEKFCMVHNNYVANGTYRLEYKLSTTRSDEGDLTNNTKFPDTYTATWSTVVRRKKMTYSEDTYIIGQWTEDASQPLYYLIDPPETVKLGRYRDYVTFFATVISPTTDQ